MDFAKPQISAARSRLSCTFIRESLASRFQTKSSRLRLRICRPLPLGEAGATASGLARRAEGRAEREPDRAKPKEKSIQILRPSPCPLPEGESGSEVASWPSKHILGLFWRQASCMSRKSMETPTNLRSEPERR